MEMPTVNISVEQKGIYLKFIKEQLYENDFKFTIDGYYDIGYCRLRGYTANNSN